jgi:alpha-tubulin suppressor-like RCC1 family protein
MLRADVGGDMKRTSAAYALIGMLCCTSSCSLDFDSIGASPADAGRDASQIMSDAAMHHEAGTAADARTGHGSDSGAQGDAGANPHADAGGHHDASDTRPGDAGEDARQTDACADGSDAALACMPDACEPNPCSAHAACAPQAAAPGYSCTCDDGFEPSGDSCVDIDECAEGTHTCHPSASCKNTSGGYDCTCPLGYAGGTPDGFACTPRIAVSYNHTCALLSSGHVSCWGDNSKGQLGDGTMMNSTSPVTVQGISTAMGIEIGALCSCAVLRDGTTWCWGQTAFGASDFSMVPEMVSGIDDASMVATDCRHSCAVRTNGHVACWGNGEGGALGNGDTSSTIVEEAVDVPGVTNAIHVSVGASTRPKSCATAKNGSAQCWGVVYLGNGSMMGSAVPVAVSGLTDAIATAQAYTHSCALRANGWVMCWGQQGFDGNGQVGSGTDDLSPVLVTMGARAISLQLYDSCVLRATGGVDCWGSDAGATPTAVSGISNAVALASEGNRGCALLDDGTIACFSASRALETPPNIDLW